MSEDGSILTRIAGAGKFSHVCTQIEELYIKKMRFKLQQVLHSLEEKQINLLVFPEYTVPADCLPMIYAFCQKEKCTCIAASHSIQQSMEEIYEKINMDISVNGNLNKSCCPIIMPTGESKHIFKRNKSKWEANMNTDTYGESDNSISFICEGQKVSVLLCIDALHVDVDKKSTDILIVPAASPSDGEFKNKFESYLGKEIPTVFCNFCAYGNSTVYCNVTENSNLPFAENKHITKTLKGEEVTVIVDIDPSEQITKSKSIIPPKPLTVVDVFPILYRDDNAEQSVWNEIKIAAEKEDYMQLLSLKNHLFAEKGSGITSQKKEYLRTAIEERTISTKDICISACFIYVNDFTLKQYEINWVEKTMQMITDGLTDGSINPSNEVLDVFGKLSVLLRALRSQIPEKIDIAVFSDHSNGNSLFQNRGGEIQQFHNAQQDSKTTIFIVEGFSNIGKSAFIDRLHELYSFKIEPALFPKTAGFETLIRWVCTEIGIPVEWDTLDNQEISLFAKQFAKYLTNLNRTIVVIDNTANLFDAYNQTNTVSFICSLAASLYELHSGIKVIIENSRKLPEAICENPNIHICNLRPLLDLYIERLIEQTANTITYAFSLPHISQGNVRQCKGNPAVAKMIGICIGEKLNNGEDGVLSKEEIANFTDAYVDGIFKTLRINEDEKSLLIEASIYRLSVRKEAFIKLPSFTESAFANLCEKLLIENESDWYTLNSLLYDSLRKRIENKPALHHIAAEYFEKEYDYYNSCVSQAEKIYHESFYLTIGTAKKELQYYANDILVAAIELINDNNYEIAMNHLISIKPYKSRYNISEFNFYYAFCCIIFDNYPDYREAFDISVSEAKGKKDVIYYRMIEKLLRKRILIEAENLLNEVCENYEHTRQMDALRVALLYENKQTRAQAMRKAKELTQSSQGEYYSAKILTRIYIHEGMVKDALKEVDAIISVWPENRWANRTRQEIIMGLSDSYDDDYEECGIEENHAG